MRSLFAVLWIRSLTKPDLDALICDVKRGNADARRRAVDFVTAESFGLWHNRARAKLCRHFKNHPPTEEERGRMVDAVTARLIDGRFFEQFRDQLSMAIRFAPERMADVADVASRSDREYVRRYAERVRHVLKSAANARRS